MSTDRLPAEGETPSQPRVARRRLLQGVVGVGVAGAAAGVFAGVASGSDPSPAGSALPADASDGPLVAHLVNARSGTIDIFIGSRVVSVTDPDLAGRLAAAAR